MCKANLEVPKIKNEMTGNDRVMSTLKIIFNPPKQNILVF